MGPGTGTPPGLQRGRSDPDCGQLAGSSRAGRGGMGRDEVGWTEMGRRRGVRYERGEGAVLGVGM